MNKTFDSKEAKRTKLLAMPFTDILQGVFITMIDFVTWPDGIKRWPRII